MIGTKDVAISLVITTNIKQTYHLHLLFEKNGLRVGLTEEAHIATVMQA